MDQWKEDRMMGRGGKRPGAGRKPSSGPSRVSISARVSQATKESLDILRERGESTGKLLDRLISDYFQKAGE